MHDFLAVTFSYPTVIFTVLLAVACLYWVMVIVGALGVDVLDFDGDGIAEGATEGAAEGAAEGIAEGAAEGIAEGAAEGMAEGAAEGMAEGATEGMAEGAAEGAAHGAAEGAAHGATEGSGHGLMGGLIHTLKLRNAPMTLVLSLIFLFSWLISHATTTALGSSLSGLPTFVWGSGVLVMSLVGSVPLTSVLVRPLGRVLKVEKQTSRSDIVGKVVSVDTSTVDGKFGTAKLIEDGNALLIQIRCDSENQLTRGDKALVVSYDEDRRAYEVTPVDDILPSVALAKK